jgi:hypothetical protein
MLKQRKSLVIAGIAILILGASMAAYLALNKKPLPPEQLELQKSICELYEYDKKSPNTHASFGPNFHNQQWQNFEVKFGPTGANTIDEFCAR